MPITAKLLSKIILGSLFLAVLYFLTRLINLTSLPVFVDEAIYIRWAQVMKNEPTLRFLPMSDGKQPLFMWMLMPFLKLFSDPLFAGRFLSVLSGFGTMIGILVFALLLTNSWLTAVISALLYVLAPFTLFFDRQALVDSLLSMFGVWSLVFGLLLVRRPRLDIALILGFILGAALLTKSPGMVFLGLVPALLLLLPRYQKDVLSTPLEAYLLRRFHPLIIRLSKFALFYSVSVFLAFAMYNLLRLGPNFSQASSRNLDYVFPLSEVFTHPLNPLSGNLKNTLSWLFNFATPPVLILSLLAILHRRKKTVITLMLLFLLPLFAQAFIAKVYTTRYFLYTLPYLLILSALGLSWLYARQRLLFSLAILVVLAFTINYNRYLWFDVTHTPLPQQMAHGYFQEWTAGFGQKEVAEYLKSRPASAKILVGTEGFFGSLPDGLQIYTEGRPNIVVIGLGHPVFSVSEKLTNALADNEVYLVVNQSRNRIPESERSRLELVSSFQKPPRPDGTREVLEFYQLH